MTLEACSALQEFPHTCAKGDACLIASAHARLREAHRHWHQALTLYSKLDDMRTYVNGTLQALRNVTWTIQGAKNSVQGFEEWYKPWQTSMESDPTLKWAVARRNRVVKSSDFKVESRARATLHGAIGAPPEITLRVDPAVSNQAIAAHLLQRVPLTDQLRRDGMILVERLWVDFELPHLEILEALAYVFSRLAQVTASWHSQFAQTEASKWREQLRTGVTGTHTMRDLVLLPPCMISFENRRSAWIRAADGDEMALEERKLEWDAAEAARIRARYKNIDGELFKCFGPVVDLNARALGIWKLVREMMQLDGFHASMAWVFRDGTVVGHHAFNIPDEAAKNLVWDELRRIVEKHGADEIVCVSERWMAPLDPDFPDRRAFESADRVEGLGLDALNSKGEFCSMLGFIERRNGATIVLEPEIDTTTHAFYLDGVRSAWGLNTITERTTAYDAVNSASQAKEPTSQNSMSPPPRGETDK